MPTSPPRSATLLLTETGALHAASPHGALWFGTAVLKTPLSSAVEAARGAGSADVELPTVRMSLRVTRLTSHRMTMFVAELTPAPHATLRALSTRQREACAFVAAGVTAPAIARGMRLSPATVRTHLQEAYRKLGVRSRRELAEVFRR